MAQLGVNCANVDRKPALPPSCMAPSSAGPGSRYHEKVDRKTRCSTVNYDKNASRRYAGRPINRRQ